MTSLVIVETQAAGLRAPRRGTRGLNILSGAIGGDGSAGLNFAGAMAPRKPVSARVKCFQQPTRRIAKSFHVLSLILRHGKHHGRRIGRDVG